MRDSAKYLGFFVQFDLAVSAICRAKEQTAVASLKPSNQTLAINEGKDDLAVAVVAQAFDHEQILIADVRFDHRVAGEASEEGKARPWRQQVMQVE